MSRNAELYNWNLFSQHIKGKSLEFEDQTKITPLDSIHERRIMDEVGITREVKKMDSLMKQFADRSHVSGYYKARKELIIGDGATEASIAGSVFGKVRSVYASTYDNYLQHSYELDRCEKEAMEAAKMIYSEEMKFVNEKYPPDYRDVLKFKA